LASLIDAAAGGNGHRDFITRRVKRANVQNIFMRVPASAIDVRKRACVDVINPERQVCDRIAKKRISRFKRQNSCRAVARRAAIVQQLKLRIRRKIIRGIIKRVEVQRKGRRRRRFIRAFDSNSNAACIDSRRTGKFGTVSAGEIFPSQSKIRHDTTLPITPANTGSPDPKPRSANNNLTS